MKWLVVVVLVLVVACDVEPREREESTELTLCRPTVPEVLMRGNATFLHVYRARVDSGGTVIDLEAEKAASGVGSIEGCVASWRLGESWRNEEITILLQWEHGQGWTRLAVAGSKRRLAVVDPAPRDYWRVGD